MARRKTGFSFATMMKRNKSPRKTKSMEAVLKVNKRRNKKHDFEPLRGARALAGY